MSMQKINKFRITQTLLGDWLWAYKLDGGYEKFLKTLRREKEPPTKAMLDGQHFEGMVNAALDGHSIDDKHEWAEQVKECANILRGSQKQVVLFKEITVDGVRFLLHGVLDFLRCGVIYDTKFSKTYKRAEIASKYMSSPQHPMYFALVPEAYEFRYLICDGEYIYEERYRPEDVKPIEQTIREFMQFLELHGLIEIYTEKWRVKS